jgi:hypothetical protein
MILSTAMTPNRPRAATIAKIASCVCLFILALQ